MKGSYANRKIANLFTFYPLSPLMEGELLNKKIDACLHNWGPAHQRAFLANCESVAPIFKTSEPSVLGVEVEAENCQHNLHWSNGPNSCAPWTSTKDHSLRNNGTEFLAPPCNPPAARKMLIQLLTIFNKQSKAQIPEFSWRTSIHVHLNMREETVGQTISLMLLYALFEKSLFQFIGEERANNHFCAPVQETDYANLISRLLTDSDAGLPPVIQNWHKYCALNIRPLNIDDHGQGKGGKGTIEFRHLEGTYDINKIVNWLNLILCLQETSRSITLGELRERIFEIKALPDYVDIMHMTFGQYTPLVKPSARQFKDILYNSVEFAKECFAPTTNLGLLLKQAKGKTTGIQEMVKIRSGFKKPTDELPKKKLK